VRKVCICITARASYARVLTVIEALRAGGKVDVQTIAAGSLALDQYGHVEPDQPWTEIVSNVLAGTTHANMAAETGLIAFRLADTFARLRPDAVCCIADRHEVLGVAVAASYMNIPVAHVQSGEISSSIDNKVRDAVTTLADVCFPATRLAAKRTRTINARAVVHLTGCPSVDLAERCLMAPATSAPVLVLFHADTTSNRSLADLSALQEAVEGFESRPTIWFWPGEDAGAGEMERQIRRWHPGHVEFRRHVPVEDFLPLLRDSPCLLGNSSVGIREASFLGTPVVNVGDRQKGRERAGNVVDVAGDTQAIIDAYRFQLGQVNRYRCSTLYGDGQSGPRIARILEDFVCSGV
jgi:UDP-hydrolysing UDP-N-acetyl-D-glucosamine 2-epimerase